MKKTEKNYMLEETQFQVQKKYPHRDLMIKEIQYTGTQNWKGSPKRIKQFSHKTNKWLDASSKRIDSAENEITDKKEM